MALSPLAIKIELLKRGITLVSIAREFNVSKQYVSHIVLGTRRHDGIEKRIADVIGRQVYRVFAPRKSRKTAA